MSLDVVDELEIGTVAPHFTVPDADGESRSLADFRGQRVVLFFIREYG